MHHANRGHLLGPYRLSGSRFAMLHKLGFGRVLEHGV